MRSEPFKGNMTTAYNKSLDKPIPYSGTFEAYESFDELKASGETLSNDEILTVVNNRRKASAVQKARQSALDAAGIVKPTNEDPQVALSNMVKILVAQGKGEDEALAIAKTVLGQ